MSASRVRRRALSASAAAVVFAALFVPTQLAVAEEPDAPAQLEHMGEYPVAEFVAAAEQLPDELVVAIERDLDESGAEYLAEAEAAVQAVDVVESLENAGVDVLGSSMDGTELVVNVSSAQDAALVESVGGVAEFGAPEELDLSGIDLYPATDSYGGQGWYWEDTTNGYVCSIGFNGFRVSTGAPEFVTAGHCFTGIDQIVGTAHTIVQPLPCSTCLTLGPSLGLPVAGSPQFGGTTAETSFDVGRVAASGSGIVSKPSIVTWGGGSGAPLATAPKIITGQVVAIVGSSVCKSGSRTGWRCGPILDVNYPASVGGSQVNSIVAGLCNLPGDSGGPAVVGTAAVGISSWTNLVGSLCPAYVGGLIGPYAGLFPMLSTGAEPTVTSAYGSTWELAVSVPKPVVTSPIGTGIDPSAVTGTLASATTPNTVSLFLDGSSTAFATVPVTPGAGTTGNWSVPLAGAPDGIHTYSVVANYGVWSKSSAVTGTFAINVEVDRITGTNRYETGLLVAQEGGYTAPVPVLFLTTGQNYPDALSAGPAAVHLGGPLMLVQPGGISADVLNAIAAFQPVKVIVLGAENSVSAAAFNQVVAAVPGSEVVRLTGVDRYGTSRLIARTAFIDDASGGSQHLFVSNGANFPDALSAGGAAATLDAPVLMVPGAASSLPPETMQLIADLGVQNIYVTGAENSVSAGIFNQLAALSGPITRLTGVNRYGTSQQINAAFFSPVEPRVLLATGEAYPDALVGSSLAGKLGGPLFITPPGCILPDTFNELVRLKITHVTILGGFDRVSTAVQALARC